MELSNPFIYICNPYLHIFYFKYRIVSEERGKGDMGWWWRLRVVFEYSQKLLKQGLYDDKKIFF